MSLVGGLIKVGAAIVAIAFGTKTGKKGYQDIKDKLRNIIKFSKECQDYSLLATKYTYIDVDGFRPLSLLGQEDFMKKIVTDPK